MRRILFVHLAGLGDLIVALPAVSAMLRGLAGSSGVFAGDPGPCALVGMSGLGLDIVNIQEAPWRALWDRAYDPAAAGVPAFDLVTELWSIGARDARYAAATGGQVIDLPPDPGRLDLGDMTRRTWAWACSRFGFLVDYTEPGLDPPAYVRREVARFLQGRGVNPPYVVIAPGGAAPWKEWPEGRFWELSAGVRKSLGMQVVMVLGPREVGRGIVAPETAADFVAREWRLPDVAALIGSAACFVGNDTGTAHLATWTVHQRAGRTPCVLLFPRLTRDAWAPRVPWARVLDFSSADPGNREAAAVLQEVSRQVQLAYGH